ncbi:hypothetical protein JTB14_028096 [Gonioctena quinquepunctata]|nr:hypothetical protein JTB14_028096 [Gonioctena quinquepunctata]
MYTNGSKILGGSGSAFTTLETNSWTIPKDASVYTSELYAFMQALEFAEFSYIFCTDSKSSIHALSNPFSKDPLVQIILVLLTIHKNNGKLIKFIWIPSHYRIDGNELADQAKQLH